MQNMCKKMDEKENKNQDLKDLKPTFRGKKIERSHKTIVQDKLNMVDEDKAKGQSKKNDKEEIEMIERQNNEKIRRKLELKEKIEKDGLKSREIVNKRMEK